MSTQAETNLDLVDEESDGPEAELASPTTVAKDELAPQQQTQPAKRPFTKEPYTYDQCTITLTLQFWPNEGESEDRRVLVSVRNHWDIPLLTVVRAGELGQLPPVVGELLERLRAELPERERAHAEREAKRTPAASPPPTPRKGKAATKPTATAPQPPNPPQSVQAPQPAVASEQLDLFATGEGGNT